MKFLTVEKINTYVQCPAKYYLIYVKRNSYPPSFKEKYLNDLSNILLSYVYYHTVNVDITENEIRKIWANTICGETRDIKEIDAKSKRVILWGVSCINAFIKRIKEFQPDISSVYEKVSISVGSSAINLNFDFITTDPDTNKMRLFSIIPEKNLNKDTIHSNLLLFLQSYAFERVYGLGDHYAFSFETKNFIKFPYIEVKDVMLKRIVEIVKNIENREFSPSISDSCYSCKCLKDCISGPNFKRKRSANPTK